MKRIPTIAALLFTLSATAQTPEVKEVIPLPKVTDRGQLPLHLPYPIVFIHGLTGNASTWGEMTDYLIASGYTYGGQLPYCLNTDYDLQYSNIYSTQTTDIQSFVGASSPINAGDFYVVNFNIDPNGVADGNDGVQSNQAAVIKRM